MRIVVFLFFLFLSTISEAQLKINAVKLDSIIIRFIREEKVPGVAVAVMQNGTPLFVRTFGQSNIEHGIPVKRKTVFELASVTKQMTAALIATLAQEGKIKLDDKIVSYIPKAPDAWKEITFRQLLGHMGGLKHKFEQQVNGSYLLNYDKEFMLDGAKKTPMNSKPGTDWEYSDQGYFLAGYAIEKATGVAFDSLMIQKFFRPMGMNDTRFLDQDNIIPNRAAGYVITNGEYKNNRRQWEFELTPHFGVMSTIDDMVKYERGIIDGKISKEVMTTITTPYRIFNKDKDHQHAYALGWEIHDFGDRRITVHSGYTGTVYLRDLKTGVSIVVLSNRDENQGTSQHVLVRRIASVVDETFPSF